MAGNLEFQGSVEDDSDDFVVKKLRDQLYTAVSSSPYAAVVRERLRAHRKHRDGGRSVEVLGWDDLLTWTTVLGEEVGEIDKAICEWQAGHLTDTQFQDALESEVLQVAAMACAWLEAIDVDRDAEAGED
jgi:hypothetical protein